MNYTLKRQFSVYRVATGKNDWPVQLQKFVDAVNNTHQTSIKKTPAEVVNLHQDHEQQYKHQWDSTFKNRLPPSSLWHCQDPA